MKSLSILLANLCGLLKLDCLFYGTISVMELRLLYATIVVCWWGYPLALYFWMLVEYLYHLPHYDRHVVLYYVNRDMWVIGVVFVEWHIWISTYSLMQSYRFVCIIFCVSIPNPLYVPDHV